MEPNTIEVTVRENSQDPKTREIKIGGPDGAKSTQLKDIMDQWSKYHGNKSLEGSLIMIDGKEAAPDQIIQPGQVIRIARAVRAGNGGI